MPKKISTEEFISRARKVHGDLYDYSHVVYTNMHTKVKIIDQVLGEFWQSPFGHLQGQGHPGNRYNKMANTRRKTTDLFIRQAREMHGDLYDYSKVVYKHCDEKVCIIDPEYGEFWQSPFQHLNSHGCPARTKNKKWLIHKDHIIPLSIICSNNRDRNKWFFDRPLYKFLDSEINLKHVSSKYNRDKSDYVTINGTTISASSVRNNYDIIALLIKQVLNIDPTSIIELDKAWVRKHFKLGPDSI